MFLLLTDEKRHEYWNHWCEANFVSQRPLLPKSVTAAKLMRVKEEIWRDEIFWGGLMPFGIELLTVELLSEQEQELYSMMMDRMTATIKARAS